MSSVVPFKPVQDPIDNLMTLLNTLKLALETSGDIDHITLRSGNVAIDLECVDVDFYELHKGDDNAELVLDAPALSLFICLNSDRVMLEEIKFLASIEIQMQPSIDTVDWYVRSFNNAVITNLRRRNGSVLRMTYQVDNPL